ASHLFTLAGSLADDVIRLGDPRREVLPRLMVVWVAIAATALAAGVFLAFAEIDVMQVAIMAFASSAAIFFPVLLLAIWWRRCTWLGAVPAVGLGVATLATAIAVGDAPLARQFRLATVIAALIGAALGLIGGL